MTQRKTSYMLQKPFRLGGIPGVPPAFSSVVLKPLSESPKGQWFCCVKEMDPETGVIRDVRHREFFVPGRRVSRAQIARIYVDRHARAALTPA